MKKNKRAEKPGDKRHEFPLPDKITPEQKKRNVDAHQQAETDMTDDAELTAHSPNDDLDEGESARLGEDKTGLI